MRLTRANRFKLPLRQPSNQIDHRMLMAGDGDGPWNAGRTWRAVVAFAFLAVIVGFLVTTMPGVRGTPGYSWWMDGILQNLALCAAVGLCLVRIRPSSPDRIAWQILAVGLTSFALAKPYYLWFVRPLDPMPAPSVSDALWWAFYPCAFVALLLLVRSRVGRLPLSLVLDGVVVGLGAATVVAAVVLPAVVARLGGSVAQTVTNLAYPVLDLSLLAAVVAAMSLFRWRPPTALWWLTAGLVVFIVVDCTYVAQSPKGGYQIGGYIDGLWVAATAIVATSPGWHGHPGFARVPPIWAPLAAPLLAAAAAIGVLVAASYVRVTPAASSLAVATLLAALGRLAVAFFEARHAGEHAEQARTDELTTLLNRRGFYDRAAAILARDAGRNVQSRCALLLLDLDDFKDVNDSLGHATGDELLRLVAGRLTAPLRNDDILTRLGGDEFALLLPHASAEEAVHVAAALIAALEETVVLDGLQVQTGASIGIAVSPEHGRDVGTLLRHADIAMYRAKRSQAGYLLYTPEAGGPVTTRADMELLGQLRRAIDQGELAVHYQPKLSLLSGDIIGVEALVRWPHPRLGLLYPDQFLPFAKQNRLMRAMTEFVVERALDDATIWHARGHRVPVAVNLSPPALSDMDLPARFQQALRRHQLTPDALTVEITEDFVLGNVERASTVLNGLRDLGTMIAIDDFGSGYSALSYLRDLPIDEVKLDRSFIAPITTDPCAAAIVRSVIELSHTLALTTVAEGVETAEEAAALESYGCDMVQGNYYSPPLTTADLLELLCTSTRVARLVTPERASELAGHVLRSQAMRGVAP
jgi:diguanylate cyclase